MGQNSVTSKQLPKYAEIPAEYENFTEQDLKSQAIMFYTFDDVVENFNSIGPRRKMNSGEADPILELKSCFNFKNDKICIGLQQKEEKRLKSKPMKAGINPKANKEYFFNLPKPSDKVVSQFQKNGSEVSRTTSSTITKCVNKNKDQKNRLAKKSTFNCDAIYVEYKCNLTLKELDFVDRNIKEKLELNKSNSKAKYAKSEMKLRVRNSNSPPKSCFSCDWIFPEELTIYDMSNHINSCIDGMGMQSKADLLTKSSLNSNERGSKVSILKTNEISFPICKHYKRK